MPVRCGPGPVGRSGVCRVLAVGLLAVAGGVLVCCGLKYFGIHFRSVSYGDLAIGGFFSGSFPVAAAAFMARRKHERR
jgi:hypothetical protein